MLGAFNRFYLGAVALPILVFAMAMPAGAEPVSRNAAAAGAVIARKFGEEVRFIDVSNWQTVDLKQDLLSGDILRTNETGQLAIVFSDRTQVRLGRNSSLVVKQVTASTDADTVLQLQSGTIWARAERGGPGVKVETPAAAAAIRGTDWTMTVNGSQTSLTVLEGLVSFSNPQGSVEVRQGEGAAATLGQAPHKITVVNSDDREQMLFYLPAREAFERMPASVLPTADIRREAARIAIIPVERRSAEDWVSLAESQLWLDGRSKTRETLATLRAFKLSSAQQARVTLIEAIIAASETRYADAAKLFAKAERSLDTKRRGLAVYGGYYARSLADPKRVEPLPNHVTSAKDAFLRAYALGVTKDLNTAIKAMAETEKRFPDDPEIPAYRAWMALLLNDRQQALEALNKAIAVDPQEPVALEMRSHYKAGILGDLDGALADAEAVTRIAPGTSSAWNQIGNIQSDRDANREAETAFRKAIELDPLDPLPHANLAGFYLNLGRLEDAKKEIDLALERDPTFSFALLVRGRYHIQTGELEKAIDDLLAGTVADPGIATGQFMLAAAQYQKGDRIAGAQALDNADRLDKNDPTIAAVRTTIAIDSYDSEGAIRNAQDYVKRSRARGGEFSTLGANQQAGSALNDAFRFQGLNSWAEYYSDAVFDPFSGMAYIDQAIRGSANPFVNSYTYGGDVINNASNDQSFSSVLQGLLLDPHLISSPTLGINLLPRPFIETSIGGGINLSGGEVGYETEANIQSYSNLPFPVSFNGTLQWQRSPDSRDFSILSDMNTENRLTGGTVYLSASPTISDRFVAYFSSADSGYRQDDTMPFVFAGLFVPLRNTIDTDGRNTSAGVGWSHTFGYENVLNTALFYNAAKSRTRNEFDIFGLPFSGTRNELRQEAYIAAVSHTIGVNDFTWRYGVEGGWIDAFQSGVFDLFGIPGVPDSASSRSGVARIYADLLHEITPDLSAEYGLFGTYIEGTRDDRMRFDPRIGLAWTPAEGQRLRAGFMRDSLDFSTPTLAPIGVLGLQQNQVSVDPGGQVDTYALRWDAEWTPDFFTAVEYQHQDINDLIVAIPLQSQNFTTGKARIDRGSLSANLLLGHGFGLTSTVAYTSSNDDDRASPSFNGPLPYIPKWAGQVALTWVSQENIRVTVAGNYVGEREDSNGAKLGDHWSLDAGLTWEPFDKRFEMALAAYNLLDEDFTIDHDILGNPIPGWGRSFKGTLKVRF